MRSRPRHWLCALALLIPLAAPAHAEPRLLGAEFRVNGADDSKQHNPTAAAAPNGRTLVVWESEKLGLRGRFYRPDGSTAGGELALIANVRLSGFPARGVETLRKDPALAFLPTGEFLLAWTEERDDVILDVLEHREILDKDVYLQRFGPSGLPIGSPVRINTATPGLQSLPKILVRSSWPVVVVWQSDDPANLGGGSGIFGRLATKANGRPFGASFRISTENEPAAGPAIAGLPSGDFLVAWEADDGNGLGSFVRAFFRDLSQTPPSYIETRVNAAVGGVQRRPAVAAAGTTGYFVVWQGQWDSPATSRIFGRFVDPKGNTNPRTLEISKGFGATQISPSIARRGNGDLLVTWLDWNGLAPLGVFAVTLDAKGNARGAEVKVSEQPLSAHFRTALALAGDSALLPWEGFIDLKQGITARRIAP
jgi:hypothetical protein